MLQTLYMLFLIGGWTCEVDKVCKIGGLALRLLRSMEHGGNDECCPGDLVRALAAELYPSKATGQQDVHETFMLISDSLLARIPETDVVYMSMRERLRPERGHGKCDRGDHGQGCCKP